MEDGIWVNGKKTVTGKWCYNWGSDTFTIRLNSKDSITGESKCFRVTGDTPEWGNWKLQRKEKELAGGLNG